MIVRLLLLGVTLLGSGCAMHAPMSEALVFSPARDGRSGLDLRGEGVIGLQFVAGSAVADSTRKPNPLGRGGGLFLATYGPSSAVSGAAGIGVLGVDATQHLAGPAYAMLSGSLLGGAEAFVLTRLPSPSRHVGLSVGAGGRCRYDLRDDPDNDSEFAFALRLRGAWACAAGGRATTAWTLHSGTEDLLLLLGTVYVGVSPTDGRLVGGFGLVTGLSTRNPRLTRPQTP